MGEVEEKLRNEEAREEARLLKKKRTRKRTRGSKTCRRIKQEKRSAKNLREIYCTNQAKRAPLGQISVSQRL